MQIFVRADSGTDIGTGHVMRCLTLAKQLRKMNFCVEFISKKLDGNITELLKKNGFKIHYLDKKITTKKSLNIDSKQTINKIIKNSKIAPFLIVDHYKLDIKWEKKMRAQIGGKSGGILSYMIKKNIFQKNLEQKFCKDFKISKKFISSFIEVGAYKN